MLEPFPIRLPCRYIFRMFYRCLLLLITLVVTPSVVCATPLSDRLASSDYVLIMRHARAPGIGDPPGFRLDDCSTQRNLNEQGVAQAQAVGQWLRQQGVSAALVYSSPWCRCKDTARLLAYESVNVESTLASFFEDMSQSTQRTQALRAFVSEQLRSKGRKALILVTHDVNIVGFVGESIAAAEMVLARVTPSGEVLSYEIIPRPQ